MKNVAKLIIVHVLRHVCRSPMVQRPKKRLDSDVYMKRGLGLFLFPNRHFSLVLFTTNGEKEQGTH